MVVTNKRTACLYFIILALACVLAGGTSHAIECSKDNMTQADMNFCALEKAKKADAELTEVYEKLLEKVSLEGKVKIRAVETAWFVYRDKQCEFNALGTSGGSVHSMIVSECLASLAEQQTKNLKAQLDCRQGDLSCGGQ